MAKHTYGESTYAKFFIPLFRLRPQYPKNIRKVLYFENDTMQYQITWEPTNDEDIKSYTVFSCQDLNYIESTPKCDVRGIY